MNKRNETKRKLMESYSICHTLKDTHKNQLLELFHKQTWLKDRTLKDIETMERTCTVFALIEKKTDHLIGFTRVLTDDVKYAYIHDVIIKDDLQGKGLGRYIIEAILDHKLFSHIVCFELLCLPEKIPFYDKFKFKEHAMMRSLRYDKRNFT